MHSDHKRYCIFPGDLCKITLKCVRCDTSITPPGTIGVTLYHAPVAILRHLEMIDHEDHPSNPPGAFDLSHVPVLFSGMDTFGRAQYSKDYWNPQYLQQPFLFPYSPMYFTRGSRSMLIWNQHWKFCSSSISKCILITNVIVYSLEISARLP